MGLKARVQTNLLNNKFRAEHLKLIFTNKLTKQEEGVSKYRLPKSKLTLARLLLHQSRANDALFSFVLVFHVCFNLSHIMEGNEKRKIVCNCKLARTNFLYTEVLNYLSVI